VLQRGIQPKAEDTEGTSQPQDRHFKVRTLNQGGKLENLKKETQKNAVSVLGLVKCGGRVKVK
jgi:hypothetical protein